MEQVPNDDVKDETDEDTDDDSDSSDYSDYQDTDDDSDDDSEDGTEISLIAELKKLMKQNQKIFIFDILQKLGGLRTDIPIIKSGTEPVPLCHRVYNIDFIRDSSDFLS